MIIWLVVLSGSAAIFGIGFFTGRFYQREMHG
jgi:hypothetical protein